MKKIKKYVSEQNMDLESFMLAQISPEEAAKLDEYIRVNIMSLEDNNDMFELLEKLQAVLTS